MVLGVIGIVAFGSINSGLSQETDAAHLAELWRRGGWLGYFFAMGGALFLLLIFTSRLDEVLAARADLQAIPTNRTGLRNTVSASTVGIGSRGFFGKIFGIFRALGAAWTWTMTWVTDMLEIWAQPKDDKQIAWTLGIGWACCGGGLAGGTLVFAKATCVVITLIHWDVADQFPIVSNCYRVPSRMRIQETSSVMSHQYSPSYFLSLLRFCKSYVSTVV